MIKVPETPEISRMSRIEKIYKSKGHRTLKIKDIIFLISAQSVLVLSKRTNDRINIPLDDYMDIYEFVKEVINETSS